MALHHWLYYNNILNCSVTLQMRLLFIIRHISGNLRKYLAPTEIEESAGPSSKKRRIEIDNDTKIKDPINSPM